NVTENSGASRFAQATLTFTGPGSSSIGGRTVSAAGEEASTSAPWSAMVTWLASASPQNPFPRISKRSANEATRGAEEICIGAAAGEGGVRGACCAANATTKLPAARQAAKKNGLRTAMREL